MYAIASLPAKAAARVKALEAGAPILAAAATAPLRLLDLRDPNTAALLKSIITPDLLRAEDIEERFPLRNARLFFSEPRILAVLATLVSCVRRFAWADLLAAQGSVEDERVLEMVVQAVQTMCLLLAGPFFICQCKACKGPKHRKTMREAAKR